MIKKRYAIIDIETTGGLFNRDKITEIAIIVTDGSDILKEFSSLVNPERSIPPFITGITGITDDMVIDAPRFYEIAKEIIEYTEDCIFVAHNARFDYSFIKEEFKSLGYPYNKKTLCTIKLAKSMVPGLKSYGLDGLINHFDIEITDRHRAYGDAYATFQLFRLLHRDMQDDFQIKYIINKGIDDSVLPRGISIEDIHRAPETAGVYYLYDNSERILYVGKAKDIRSRIFQHFRALSRKSINIHNMVGGFHYRETGSELIALLLELSEIKQLKPELNKSLKRSHYPFGIFKINNQDTQNATFLVAKNNDKNNRSYELLKLFSTRQSAEHYLQELIFSEELCRYLIRSSRKEFSCFCETDCLYPFPDHEHISQISNNLRNEFEEDFVLLTNGRNPDETGFVLIKCKKFYGFGFIERQMDQIVTWEDWENHLDRIFYYPEANGIIKNYLNKNDLRRISKK